MKAETEVITIKNEKIIRFLREKEEEKRQRNIEFAKTFRFDESKLIEVKNK